MIFGWNGQPYAEDGMRARHGQAVHERNPPAHLQAVPTSRERR